MILLCDALLNRDKSKLKNESLNHQISCVETLDNPLRFVDAFVTTLDNRLRSWLMLERETARNVELMCLPGKITPDFNYTQDYLRGPFK